MSKASEKSKGPMLPGLSNPISLPALADGLSRYDLRDGPRTEKSGQVRAPVNLSRQLPQIGKEWQTKDTYGLSFDDSSPSVCLQLSLESRLLQRMAEIGSMEYRLTWKHWAIGSRRLICALRASAPRPSGRGSIGSLKGYPTCRANDAAGDKTPPGRQGGDSLKVAARLMGYATPQANKTTESGPLMNQDGTPWDGRQKPHQNGRAVTTALADQARMMGTRMDSQKIMPGGRRKSDDGQTGQRGALNPALARWLMGFPAEWDSCGATAMQSSRRSQRSL